MVDDQAKDIEALKAKYPARSANGKGRAYSGDDVHAAINEAVALSRASQPIDMVLFCPACGVQHIDDIEAVLVWTGGAVPEPSHDEVTWDNPPHRSHLCGACGCIWRPADVATNGVKSVQTKGEVDTFDPAVDRPLSRASQGSRVGTEERDARISRLEGLLKRVLSANIARGGEHSRIPLVKDIQHALAAAPIAALSPSATPQAQEDALEAVFQMIHARTSHWIAKELTADLDRAHLLATPVTVTMEECEQIAHSVYANNTQQLIEALRRVLGDRIQIAGSEGPK